MELPLAIDGGARPEQPLRLVEHEEGLSPGLGRRRLDHEGAGPGEGDVEQVGPDGPLGA